MSSRWIHALLSQDSLTDSLAGFARWSRSQLALEPFTAIIGFAQWIARYSRWIYSVSSQWILALLSQDSLADSTAVFVRWIRLLLSLDPPGEFSVDSRAALL
jgi:hypothetical protein